MDTENFRDLEETRNLEKIVGTWKDFRDLEETKKLPREA